MAICTGSNNPPREFLRQRTPSRRPRSCGSRVAPRAAWLSAGCRRQYMIHTDRPLRALESLADQSPALLVSLFLSALEFYAASAAGCDVRSLALDGEASRQVQPRLNCLLSRHRRQVGTAADTGRDAGQLQSPLCPPYQQSTTQRSRQVSTEQTSACSAALDACWQPASGD